MAGNGPPPKDPNKRARTNKDAVIMRILPAILAEQPELPTIFVETDGELTEFIWPQITREWWAMWADSPLAADFTSTDWSELRDTALLHAKFWTGATGLAGELRLRTAKFGATPEDRLRLRIQFAQAADAEISAATKAATSRQRFPGMKVTDELGA